MNLMIAAGTSIFGSTESCTETRHLHTHTHVGHRGSAVATRQTAAAAGQRCGGVRTSGCSHAPLRVALLAAGYDVIRQRARYASAVWSTNSGRQQQTPFARGAAVGECESQQPATGAAVPLVLKISMVRLREVCTTKHRQAAITVQPVQRSFRPGSTAGSMHHRHEPFLAPVEVWAAVQRGSGAGSSTCARKRSSDAGRVLTCVSCMLWTRARTRGVTTTSATPVQRVAAGDSRHTAG